MHHLFVTPLVAGVVTAGIIGFTPGFSDPYESEFATEEPVVERLDLELTSSIAAPAELEIPHFPASKEIAVHFSTPVRVAELTLDRDVVLSDAAFVRSDIGLAAAKISQVKTIKLSTALPHLQVAASRMNMRSGPGTGFGKIGQLVRGTELIQTGNSKGSWLEVSVLNSGQIGWLHSKYLTPAQ